MATNPAHINSKIESAQVDLRDRTGETDVDGSSANPSKSDEEQADIRRPGSLEQKSEQCMLDRVDPPSHSMAELRILFTVLLFIHL